MNTTWPIMLPDLSENSLQHKNCIQILDFELDLLGESQRISIGIRDPFTTLPNIIPLARSLSSVVVRRVLTWAHKRHTLFPCHKGCHAACCHYLTLLSIPEALRLTQEVMNLPTAQQKMIMQSCYTIGDLTEKAIAEMSNRNKTLNMADLGPAQLSQIGDCYNGLEQPCPFLSENLCTIYENRPIVCREWLVVGAASQCQPSQSRQPRRIRLPFHTTVALIELTSELQGKQNKIAPLFGMFDCYVENVELNSRTWPAVSLVERFVEIIRRLQKETIKDWKQQMLIQRAVVDL